MIIRIDDLSLNVVWDENDLLNKIPVIFLHGFTGNINDWSFIKGKLAAGYTPILIDLIGHGKSSSPAELKYYSYESQVGYLLQIINKLNLVNPILVGYSMGGRLALTFTFSYPPKVKALVLESTSFGLEKNSDKEERILNDKTIADRIQNSTLEEFINYWVNIPLFTSLKKMDSDKFEKLLDEKIASNNSIGLANSLLGFSTGKMKNYNKVLSNLEKKVLLITGAMDEKFTAIGKSVVKDSRNCKLEIINDCGHNVHLENPEEFLKLLNSFLLNIRESK